jgi:hypothetical protein
VRHLLLPWRCAWSLAFTTCQPSLLIFLAHVPQQQRQQSVAGSLLGRHLFFAAVADTGLRTGQCIGVGGGDDSWMLAVSAATTVPWPAGGGWRWDACGLSVSFKRFWGCIPGTSPWGRQRGDSLSGPFGWMAVAKVALDQRDLWLN